MNNINNNKLSSGAVRLKTRLSAVSAVSVRCQSGVRAVSVRQSGVSVSVSVRAVSTCL